MTNRRFFRRTDSPPVRFSATAAWSARDAIVNAGVVDSWPSWIGRLSLAPGGTKKSQPVSDPLLGGELAIPSAGAGVGYSVALAVGTTQTLVVVGRYATSSSAFIAHTVGGVVNTGQSVFYQSGAGVNGRCLAATAASPNVATLSLVSVTVLTATGVTHYVNSYTAVTAAGGPTALAGDSLRVFDLSSGGVFPLNGAIAEVQVYNNRAFTAREAAYTIDYYAEPHGIRIP